MKRTDYLAALLAVCSVAVAAQPAQLEVSGVFGECLPVWAASNDQLQLHRKPDLRSERSVLPFKSGWRIAAPKRDGMTRVLRIGKMRVTEPDDRMYCRVEPSEGPTGLVVGELVEYLYYVGEGFGEIRFRGAECYAQVVEKLGHFEAEVVPEVQVWLRVFHADGTSPGWLLHDGTQTQLADVLC